MNSRIIISRAGKWAECAVRCSINFFLLSDVQTWLKQYKSHKNVQKKKKPYYSGHPNSVTLDTEVNHAILPTELSTLDIEVDHAILLT